MPIPKSFETIMLPMLKILADGKSHNTNGVIDNLSDYFKLTNEEKSLKFPTGSTYVFRNRSRFARLYLLKAGLIEDPERGFIKISQEGINVLKNNPKEINLKLLGKLPKFINFKKELKNKNKEKKESITSDSEVESQTPFELIEYGYQKIKEELAQDIINNIKKSSPQFFEKLVVDLLLKMGYGGSLKDAGKAIGQSGDGGIDGIIKEDRLGLDVIYIQAKKWEAIVGRPEIQKFVGALAGKHANKGVFITTSDFSKEARDFVNGINNKVILVDSEMLTELMIENDLGVSTIVSYDVKTIDSDYFIEE